MDRGYRHGGRLHDLLTRATRSQAVVGIALLIPAFAFFITFILYPIAHAIWLSFQDLYLMRGIDSIEPYGFGNFRRFFADPRWTLYVRNTVIWTFGSVIGEVALGLLLALLLNRRIPFRPIWRGIVILPWLMPPVVVAIVWRWILDGEWGVLNYALMNLGVIESRISWLTNRNTMWISILMISWWKSIPFSFVNLLAGLQMIPSELYEAAIVDGASLWHRFRMITLPLLRPVLVVVTLLMTIWRSHDFNLLWALTRGGPAGQSTTLAILSYKVGFEFYRVAYGASIGVLLMAFMLMFTGVYMRRIRLDI